MAVQIEVKDDNGNWSTEAAGDSAANTFDTSEAAQQAINDLKALGGEWADAEYRIVDK